MSAGAPGNGVRVVDGEAAAHEGVDVVDLGTFKIHGAEIVDQKADAVHLDDFVTLFGALLDGHTILKPGAAARRDEDAQRALWRALLGKKSLELLNRLRGNRDHREVPPHPSQPPAGP